MLKYLSAAAAMALLGGCASITSLGDTFEGAADYVVVPLAQPRAGESAASTPNEIQLNSYSRFQNHPTKAGDAEYFRQGDYIHLSLKTGTIGWFSEGLGQRFLNRLAGAFGESPLKGEIALIANVTEGKRAPGSRAADGTLEGRVVFYSDDIYPQQRLNEFNVPIFGPKEYQGGPLTIDLWLMELDRAESDQMGAVLQTLSELSRSVPSLALPGVDILSQIGTSFLKSNRDDIIGHFTVTLVPPTTGLNATDPILSVSDVIVKRSDLRRTNLSFDGCTYQPRSGEVKGCLRTDDNLFVLSLRKAKAGADISSEVTLAQLNERLGKADSYAALQQSLDELADIAWSANLYKMSLGGIERIQDPNTSNAVREYDGRNLLQQLQCALVAEAGPAAEVLESLCGARAKNRHMSMNDFHKVARNLTEATCIKPAMLSKSELTPELTKDRLEAAKAKLVAFLVPKGADCPASSG
jgi:hypothetical protein